MYGQEVRWDFPGKRQKVLAFTDLHFCDKIAGHRASVILKTLRRVCRAEGIQYIFFLGDLINSLDVLNDTVLRARLKYFLDELSKLATVIIVTGNHDVSYYNNGATRGQMHPEQWYRWAQVLMQNERIRVLDEALYDDGVIRVLGMSLPEVCYPTVVNKSQDPVKAFRAQARRMLPELTKVKNREYYLLLHNPQFLSKIELDPQIAVLAGHMHNGLVPPVVDELTRFSQRGLVGPGYYSSKGRKMSYVPLANGARYHPRTDQPWLTLNSCTHMPPESWLWIFDWIFPALSYAVISGNAPQMKFASKYFWLRDK